MTERTFSDMTPEATARLGENIGARLTGGEFIALFGELGAGKTTLAKSIALSLQIERVQSPTFTIVREYQGRLPLLHFDAYRLSSADELYAIGYEDYLARGSVIIMEWCENVPDALPCDRLEIHISGCGGDKRSMRLICRGSFPGGFLEGIE